MLWDMMTTPKHTFESICWSLKTRAENFLLSLVRGQQACSRLYPIGIVLTARVADKFWLFDHIYFRVV